MLRLQSLKNDQFGQKLKNAQVMGKTILLELFCGKNSSKKHQILEK